MLRQGFRRVARQAGRAAPGFALPKARGAMAVSQQLSMYSTKPLTPLRRIATTYCNRTYSTEANAVDQSQESSAPAASQPVSNFADLSQLGVNERLLDAITGDMGYGTMTPVQAQTINPALKGTDIVAQARTGTGKTIAFLLPLLQRMINEDPSLATRSATRTARSDDIRGIVISPTRELAEQIAAEARRLVENTGLVVQCAVGGTSKSYMLRETRRRGCHLLVATPGRLNDLLRDPDSGIDAPNLAALVLDEADRMLDVGFEKELNDIIRCLPSPEEKVRQTMLVSATIPDDVIRLARTMVRPHDFEFVQTIPENETLTHEKIPQHVVALSGWADMFPKLWELIDGENEKRRVDRSQPPFKAIVYMNTTALTELAGELAYQRRAQGLTKIPTFSIHSKNTQSHRTKAAEKFRTFKSGILFSSDVTARGMDFPDVTHVIQVDCPRDRESYIHRLGRTGRQNKAGEGWLFLPPNSVSQARSLLRGLPLQHSSLPDTGEQGGDSSKLTEELREIFQGLPVSMMENAYTSMVGGAMGDKVALVEDMNDLATRGWGMTEPPAVSSDWARKLGLSKAPLNIRNRRRFSDMERQGSDRPRYDRRGPPRRSFRNSDDPFDNIRSQVRRG